MKGDMEDQASVSSSQNRGFIGLMIDDDIDTVNMRTCL